MSCARLTTMVVRRCDSTNILRLPCGLLKMRRAVGTGRGGGRGRDREGEEGRRGRQGGGQGGEGGQGRAGGGGVGASAAGAFSTAVQPRSARQGLTRPSAGGGGAQEEGEEGRGEGRAQVHNAGEGDRRRLQPRHAACYRCAPLFKLQQSVGSDERIDVGSNQPTDVGSHRRLRAGTAGRAGGAAEGARLRRRQLQDAAGPRSASALWPSEAERQRERDWESQSPGAA